MSNLHAFYTSNKWQDLKTNLILDRGMICEVCHKEILHRHECVAHHIIELTSDNVKDATISLNPGNLMLVHMG